MRIHEIRRHQYSVETKRMFGCYFQHIQMHMWIFMAGETNEANFTSGFGLR
jgi:hypothetical protein